MSEVGWAVLDAPGGGQVMAVRVRTSPLVELRARWDHPEDVSRTGASDSILAERLMDLASSPAMASRTACHLTAHANHHRFGIAGTCWREDWTSVLHQILRWLATDVLPEQDVTAITLRNVADRFHRRGVLDALADDECLDGLLGSTRQGAAAADSRSKPEQIAAGIAATQHRLRTAAPLLVIVGNLDPHAAAQAAVELLGTTYTQASRAPRPHSGADTRRGCVWSITTRGTRSACRLGTIVPSYPGSQRAIAEVVAHLLGNPESGLLVDRLRHQLGLSYDARCLLEDLGPQRVLMCKAVVASAHADQAIAEMRTTVLTRLTEHIHVESALADGRMAVAAARVLVDATPSALASALIKEWAAGLTPADAFRGGEHAGAVLASDIDDFVTERFIEDAAREGHTQ